MSEEDKVPSPDGVGVVPEPETVRRRPKWLAPVAAGCVLVLLAVGGVAGCRVWSARELAEAREACAVAADGVRGAANDYNAVVNGQAADASAVTVDQVKDARTVDALAKALKTTVPEYEGCLAGSKAGLDEATSKLDRQAAWYRTHAASLGKAVKAVESSGSTGRSRTRRSCSPIRRAGSPTRRPVACWSRPSRTGTRTRSARP